MIGEDIELKTLCNPDAALVTAGPSQVEQVYHELALRSQCARDRRCRNDGRRTAGEPERIRQILGASRTPALVTPRIDVRTKRTAV